MRLIHCLLSAILPTTALLAAPPADAQQHRQYEITVASECDSPMRLAVYHSPHPGEWHSRYWYTLNPGDFYYLNIGSNRIKHRIGDKFLYIYAETVDGRGYFPTKFISEHGRRFRLKNNLWVLGLPASGSTDRESGVYDIKVPCNAR